MSSDLDALGLLDFQDQSVRFGPIEAYAAVVRGDHSHSVNRVPKAQIRLRRARLSKPIDYFSSVVISSFAEGRETREFTGSVVRAAPDTQHIVIDAVGGVSLSETLSGGMTTRNVSPPELVYVLARNAGFDESHLQIQGLDALARETFEVVGAIDGVAVDEPVDFGGVRFLPPHVGKRSIKHLDVDDDLCGDFESSCYALAAITTDRCLDAEEQGLAAIDLSLSWLVVRLRYGLSVLPDGRALPFERESSLASPVRRSPVLVRGLSTRRCWLRRPDFAKDEHLVRLASDGLRFDTSFPSLSLQDQLAIRSLSRAARERDLLAAVHGLFESVEFYTAGFGSDKLFTKQEQRELRRSLPNGLSEQQRVRAEYLLENVNNAPLRVRLDSALLKDSVPIEPTELEVLWRLRELRNDVAHGRKSDVPGMEDLQYGISIVARMLVHRVARRMRGEDSRLED